MLRKSAAKALWLAKGAALFWGSALTLALVIGAATTALAAVPGDPLKLGKVNFVNNAVTTLVGTKSGGPMLVVDNNSSVSGSKALDLRVAPGRSPMVVSAGAGKAKNLNADKLDGKEPSQIKGAKAYARVIPDTPFSDLGFDPARTSGFTSVARVDTGKYCLTAPGLSSDNRPAVVSVDWEYTISPEANAAAMFSSGCDNGGFLVVTKRTILSGGVLTDTYENDVGFTIAVP